MDTGGRAGGCFHIRPAGARVAGSMRQTALTLHFCDEVFASRRAQKFRAGRVSVLGRMFGLRMCRGAAVAAQVASARWQTARCRSRNAEGRSLVSLVACVTWHLSLARAARLCLASTFAGPGGPTGFSRAFAAQGRRSGLMRYRSATVAGFHGFSRCPRWCKERRTALHFGPATGGNAMRF
jgi:hypothetical protein